MMPLSGGKNHHLLFTPNRLIIYTGTEVSMRDVPQVASLRGNPMTRQFLIAVGATLLTIGGSGIIVALVWLTADKLHGNLTYIYDSHAEGFLFLLPVLLLAIAIVGAIFLSSALATPPKDTHNVRNLHPHTRFHA